MNEIFTIIENFNKYKWYLLHLLCLTVFLFLMAVSKMVVLVLFVIVESTHTERTKRRYL